MMQQTLILMIAGAGGSLVTFLLQKYGCSVVVASCIVGLAGALMNHFTSIEHLSLVIFAGSFVGMTSISLGSIPLVIFGGILTGLLYQFSLKIFDGFGGRLGTIAFISTLVAFYVLLLLKKIIGQNVK